jgi:hypothetical protein
MRFVGVEWAESAARFGDKGRNTVADPGWFEVNTQSISATLWFVPEILGFAIQTHTYFGS